MGCERIVLTKYPATTSAGRAYALIHVTNNHVVATLLTDSESKAGTSVVEMTSGRSLIIKD